MQYVIIISSSIMCVFVIDDSTTISVMGAFLRVASYLYTFIDQHFGQGTQAPFLSVVEKSQFDWALEYVLEHFAKREKYALFFKEMH